MTARLYTFSISHFAEKARWALDYKRIQYAEARLVPGPHVAIVKRLAPRSTVPLLVDGDRAIQGSSAIIDHADRVSPERPLTPAEASERERVLAFERWLDHDLGEPLRRVFYFYALNHRAFVIALLTQGAAWWGPMFCRLSFPLLAARIRQMYAITEANVATDKDRVARAYERIDAMLAQNPYLFGDRFGRADLTLAALTAPMWRPEQHPVRWPAAELYPAEVTALGERFAQTRAREHTLRCYREQRFFGL